MKECNEKFKPATEGGYKRRKIDEIQKFNTKIALMEDKL